ncbi:MAG: hypothetical protein ACRD07_12700 [Acidimicrobiales bacterium]
MDDNASALERAEAELRDWLVAHGATVEQVAMLGRRPRRGPRVRPGAQP